MSDMIGIVLERPSGPDFKNKTPLWGDMGAILTRTLAHQGVRVDQDCIVTYAVPQVGPERSIDVVKPHIARVQEEMAPCTKVLCCGAMAVAATYPQHTVPLHYHKKRGRAEMSTWGAPQKLLMPTYSLQQIWRDPDYYRDFYFDVQKLCHLDAPQPQPEVATTVVRTVPEAVAALRTLRSASIIACDIETEPGPLAIVHTDDDRKRASLDPLLARISSIGFGVMYRSAGHKGYAVVIPKELLYPKSQYLCGALLDLLGPRSSYAGTIVWQNYLFDARHLRVYLDEWPFHPHTADTLLMNYALDERPIGRYGVHSLKDMARYRFDREYGFDWGQWNGASEEDKPYDELYQYNGEDCFHTARMYEILRAEMREQPSLEQLVDGLLVPASKALAQVTSKGMLVQSETLRRFSEKLQVQMEDDAQYLADYAAQYGVSSFDASSPQQVAQFLYGTLQLPMPPVKLKGKKPGDWSTQKMVLDKVRRMATDDQRCFMDRLIAFRLRAKTRSTYVCGVQKHTSADGRIHPNFRLAGTATGRLASHDPNLQNIPVHTAKDFRTAFIAPPGYSLIEADFKNLELRVAAYFSQEPVLVDAFRRGADLHRETAAKVFNKPVDHVTEHERFLAKAVGFGLLYGRSAEAIAEGREMDEYEAHGGTRWTLEAARQFHDDYLNSMPVLKKWIQDHTQRSFQAGMTLTPYGRIRRFNLILPHTRGEVERQIVNTVIQSTASDITLEALIKLVDALPDGAWCILTIHDSILVECRDDLVPRVSTLMRTIMEQPSLPDGGVPWTVDLHVAKNWADLKE